MLYAVCSTMLLNVPYCNVLRRLGRRELCQFLHMLYVGCMLYAVCCMLYHVIERFVLVTFSDGAEDKNVRGGLGGRSPPFVFVRCMLYAASCMLHVLCCMFQHLH